MRTGIAASPAASSALAKLRRPCSAVRSGGAARSRLRIPASVQVCAVAEAHHAAGAGPRQDFKRAIELPRQPHDQIESRRTAGGLLDRKSRSVVLDAQFARLAATGEPDADRAGAAAVDTVLHGIGEKFVDNE